MLDRAEIEGIADSMRPADQPLDLSALCRREGVRVQRSRNVVGLAATGKLRGETWIFLRHLLSKVDARFGVAHELMEIRLARLGYCGEDIEAAANYGAAALLAPRVVFWRSSGDLDLPRLADAFQVTQTLAALRIGELTGDPRLVVCPHRVYVAGDGHFPEERVARALARGPERPGIRRTRLTDGRRRTLVELAA